MPPLTIVGTYGSRHISTLRWILSISGGNRLRTKKLFVNGMSGPKAPASVSMKERLSTIEMFQAWRRGATSLMRLTSTLCLEQLGQYLFVPALSLKH